MRKFFIRTSLGPVAGFNSTHQIVQTCANDADAKTFPTVKAATTWAERYQNAGYGLTSFTVDEIIQEGA